MDYFKITTDETLRETVQHGSERYPFASVSYTHLTLPTN